MNKLIGPDDREKLLHDPNARLGPSPLQCEVSTQARNTLGHSTASAYFITGLPDQPGCPLSSLPALWNQAFKRAEKIVFAPFRGLIILCGQQSTRKFLNFFLVWVGYADWEGHDIERFCPGLTHRAGQHIAAVA